MAIEAGQRLLAASGPDAITTRRIAGAIGYAPGTLYNIFDDLDDLKLRINERSLLTLRNALVQAREEAQAQPDARPLDVVMALARAQLRFMQRDPELWQQLFRFQNRHSDSLPDWYLAEVMATMQELELALVPAFPDDRQLCAEVARALWASFFGICQIASLKRLGIVAPQQIEPLTRLIVESCLRGLAPTGK